MSYDVSNPPADADGLTDTPTRTRVRSRSTGRAPRPEGPEDIQTDQPAGEDGEQPGYSKRRTRPRSNSQREPATEAPPAAEVAVEEEPETVVGTVEVPGALDEPEVDIEAETPDDGEPAMLLRRRRRRRATGTASDEPQEQEPPLPDPDAAAEDAEDIEDAEDAEDEQAPRPARRRRRGGRGRGRRGGRSTTTAPPEEPVAEDEAEPPEDTAVETGPSTRLATRGRGRARGRERGPSGLARGGRRPIGTVSEETRRAIAEGPPKRMLVTVGEQRTQLVVLEARDLVEHYVTRREDVSYVGNIYMGRIQNVLPGMEAAFVDIGKGRNGVLYAGEVNYDEADLDGELPRIEQTLKPGQSVLVQVTKDPMGTKGARLTQQLSIAGRYCVLAPNDAMLGISRKLPEEERERLRGILKAIKPEDYGLIVRTAAEGATREQLEDDVARLVRIWEQVSARAEQAQPLEPVYEEPELVIRVIRDIFGPDFTDLIVDDATLADQVRDYLRDVSPELVDRVALYEGDGALFDGYEVTIQIRRALEKKVWLASGGYLIVEKTEAMWVIDVNTGKFVGTSNLEETVLRNNLEAAEEIARQLRLRDMGGIIVIDFVDMLVPANRDEVLKRFKRELARDKTKSRVMEISKLGLVQMTRKNVSQGLNESFTVTCDCCEGRGAQIVESMLG